MIYFGLAFGFFVIGFAVAAAFFESCFKKDRETIADLREQIKELEKGSNHKDFLLANMRANKAPDRRPEIQPSDIIDGAVLYVLLEEAFEERHILRGPDGQYHVYRTSSTSGYKDVPVSFLEQKKKNTCSLKEMVEYVNSKNYYKKFWD